MSESRETLDKALSALLEEADHNKRWAGGRLFRSRWPIGDEVLSAHRRRMTHMVLISGKDAIVLSPYVEKLIRQRCAVSLLCLILGQKVV